MKINKKILFSTLGFLGISAIVGTTTTILSSCNSGNNDNSSIPIQIDSTKPITPNTTIADTSKITKISEAVNLSKESFNNILKDKNKYKEFVRMNLQNYFYYNVVPKIPFQTIPDADLVNLNDDIIKQSLNLDKGSLPIVSYQQGSRLDLDSSIQIDKLIINSNNSINFTLKIIRKSNYRIKYLNNFYKGNVGTTIEYEVENIEFVPILLSSDSKSVKLGWMLLPTLSNSGIKSVQQFIKFSFPEVKNEIINKEYSKPLTNDIVQMIFGKIKNITLKDQGKIYSFDITKYLLNYCDQYGFATRAFFDKALNVSKGAEPSQILVGIDVYSNLDFKNIPQQVIQQNTFNTDQAPSQQTNIIK